MGRNEHGLKRQIGLTALGSAALLIVLRFGARSYPGWYFPSSLWLNRLLNSSVLFTDFGYGLVLIGAAAASARPFMPADTQRYWKARRFLFVVQWVAFALALAIALYGLWWASYMQRLPWQPG